MNFGMHIATVKKKSTKKDELEKKNVSGKKLPVILIYPILTNNLKLFYMSFTEINSSHKFQFIYCLSYTFHVLKLQRIFPSN